MSSIHTFAPSDLISRIEGNIVSDMDGEKVMLSVRNGKYYNLGDIGGHIWEMLASPAAFASIVDNLFAEYDVARTECEHQVAAFLSQLLSERLITVESP